MITPNPFTSGGAKWNIMAAYGAQLEAGKSEQEAKQYLKDLFDNVPVQDKSAREALQTFIGGKGDVLLAYENEAITAQQKDQPLDYTVPEGTILIQNPIAVTIGASAKAAKFVEFTRSDEGAEDLRREGIPLGQRGPRGRGHLPDAEEPVHDRRPRRLARREQGVLRPGGQRDGQSINQDKGFPTEK